MKFPFLFFTLFLLSYDLFAQAQTNTSFTQHRPIEKTASPKTNPEKLAWEMMLPMGYGSGEKTQEIKAYEEILLRMRAGVGELTLLMGELNIKSEGK